MSTRPSTDLFGGPPSGPQPAPMPRSIEHAGPSVMLAWAMQQTTPADQGEVNDDVFRLISASRDDARELVNTWTYEIIGGPPQGYRGGALLDSLPDDQEAVTAARTVVRCISYEALLQAQAPALQQAVTAAQVAADLAAYEAVAQDQERYKQQVTELMNNPRNGGVVDRELLAAIRPPRMAPDMTEVRRAQARLERLASEIGAVRRRTETAGKIAHDTLARLADAAARLLWLGPEPGITQELPDWTAMYTAYDCLLELCGLATADQLMDKAVKRWPR